MTQPLIDLAPAEQAADATVSALQGAPAAPMPGAPAPVAPAPASTINLAPAEVAANATVSALGAAPPAVMPDLSNMRGIADATPAPSVSERASGLESAALPGELPSAGNTMSVTTQQSGTPSQIKGQAKQLAIAQDADARATASATRDAARNDVIAWANKRAREELERQRLEREQGLMRDIKERTTRELDELSKQQDDPDRVFSGEGGAWPIVSTVLGMAAMVAMGGGIPGALIGLSMGLGRAVRDDIARQRNQRGTRLEYLTGILGDAQLAEKRLAVEQTGLVAMQAETMAAEEKARGAFGIMSALAEKMRSEHAREAQQFGQAHETKTATETLSDLYTSLKTQDATGKPEAQPVQLNPETAEEVAFMQQNLVDPNDRGHMAQYAKFVETLSKTEAGLNNIGSAEGMVKRMAAGEDVPGLGTFDEAWNSSRLLSTEEGSRIMQTFGAAKEDFLRMKSGAAITDSEMARLDRIVAGRGTREDVLRGLQIMRNGYQSLRDVEANANLRFQRVYEGLKAIRQRRGRDAAGVESAGRRANESRTATAHADMTDKYDAKRKPVTQDLTPEEQADRLLIDEE